MLVCIASPLAYGEGEFDRAEVTKTIHDVSIWPQKTKAIPGTILTRDLSLKTGGDSRAELQFPNLTITRVGSNAHFRFLADEWVVILDSGTLMYSAPKGGRIRAGKITAEMKGTEILMSFVKEPKAKEGQVKAICLNGKVSIYFTANPRESRGLKSGQMVTIPPGATKMPASTTINLTTLLATSRLGQAGGLGPFPNQAAIEKNASKQQDASLLGSFFPGINSLLTQPGSLAAQAMTTSAGAATRSITTAQQAATQQAAAQQAAVQQAAARAAQQQAAQQAAVQQAAIQQAAAQQAAQQAAQGNQGRGPQGNQGQGVGVGGTPPGQGNQGRGPQGNQGNPNPGTPQGQGPSGNQGVTPPGNQGNPNPGTPQGQGPSGNQGNPNPGTPQGQGP